MFRKVMKSENKSSKNNNDLWQLTSIKSIPIWYVIQ